MSPQQRYLELLKNAVLDELYLENEVRFMYIFATLAVGKPIDQDVLRNIAFRIPDLVNRVRVARQEGRPWWNVDLVDGQGNRKVLDLRNFCEFSHTMIGRKRLNNIEYCLDCVREDAIHGDIAETGVWRGGASIFMKGYLEIWDMTDRQLWVADSFEGLPVPTLPQDQGWDFSAGKVPILAISLEEVQDNFRRYGLLDERVRFLKGGFRETLPTAPIEKLAVLRLDGDLYESTMDALNALYHKVVPGGFIIVDDYGDFEPCRRAIHEFRDQHGIADQIETIDWAGSFWRKSR